MVKERKHPQDFTAPLRKSDPMTSICLPQTHWHSHVGFMRFLFPDKFSTVSRACWLPVSSIDWLFAMSASR
jgi:hypothetical protein